MEILAELLNWVPLVAAFGGKNGGGGGGGGAESQLSRDLGFGGHESAEEAARTPVWLATQPVGGEVSGRYFADLREAECRFGKNDSAVEALYEAVHRLRVS